MHIFITGASGFVGGGIAKALSRAHSVRAMSRSEQSDNSLREMGVTLVCAELGAVRPEHLSGCEVVIHCAAFVSQWGTREQFWTINVDGTDQLIQASRQAGITRFIYIGSEAVVFQGQAYFVTDDSTTTYRELITALLQTQGLTPPNRSLPVWLARSLAFLKGKIINISSDTIWLGVPMLLHYVASKGAVFAFTRALARELSGTEITVNAITPGFTLTEGTQGMADPETIAHVQAGAVERQIIKRSEEPADLAGTVVFLASDESDFITGQTINVNGGATHH